MSRNALLKASLSDPKTAPSEGRLMAAMFRLLSGAGGRRFPAAGHPASHPPGHRVGQRGAPTSR